MGRFAEALEELRIAAKITEEEGDTPLLSYIREFIGQVTRALRRITYEEEYRVVQETRTSPRIAEEEEISGRSGLLVAQAETIITTMFSQRKVITDHRDGSSGSETSVDGEVTMRSNKTRGESCGGSSVGSDSEEDRDESVLERSSRAQDLPRTSRTRDDDSTSCVSFSVSFSDVECTEGIEDIEEDVEEIEDKGRSNIGDQRRGSITSMKTVSTAATYVIEEEESGSRTRRVLDTDDRKKGASRVFDRNSKRESREDDSRNDKVESEKEGMLNVLRVMEELNDKNEVELLEMVADMVKDTPLTRDENDREHDFGNSGDTNREDFVTPRSSEDSEAARTFRKYSVPPSPRKCDADGDFHDRGSSLRSN